MCPYTNYSMLPDTLRWKKWLPILDKEIVVSVSSLKPLYSVLTCKRQSWINHLKNWTILFSVSKKSVSSLINPSVVTVRHSQITLHQVKMCSSSSSTVTLVDWMTSPVTVSVVSLTRTCPEAGPGPHLCMWTSWRYASSWSRYPPGRNGITPVSM